ncbi:MAG: primosomal protein N', partial [Thermodesulfobacteriota bacterium]
MPQKLFIDVAIELPIDKLFTYSVPDALSEQADIGKRVLVPFRRRFVTGYTAGFKRKPDLDGVKDIVDVLDEEPLFDDKRLRFFKWISSYYLAPLGEVLGLACPGYINIKSRRHFYLTDEGKKMLDHEKGVSGNLLRAAEGGISLVALIKRFKRHATYSLVNDLLRRGLIREELQLKGGSGPRIERFVTVSGEDVNAEDLRKKAPIQAKIISCLIENGETSVKVLRKKLGGIDQPLKRLEEKRLVVISKREVERDPFASIQRKPTTHEPNKEQKAAVREIISAIKNRRFASFLLYGVTGSGKTLVYIKAIEEVLASGRGVIFLVPEISLTPWPAGYLSHIFPGRVAIMHSGLSEGERFDQWRRIRDGDIDIVVGARSALFAPLKNPGLIIVDEEHERSYKQEDGVRYNARDVALMMGKSFGLTVVLGSATPSIEAFYNSKIGKIKAIHLTKRVENRPMPTIDVVDMRRRREVKKAENGVISDRLKMEMEEALAEGNQVMLFLNRRGFSSFLLCKECGYTFRCRNCSVSLTMHKKRRILLCHYCDFSLPIPDTCPDCKGYSLVDIGLGTERVEDEVRRFFPGARVARMDSDTTRKKGSHSRIIDAVEKRDVDILIGTQMIAKGHHFPSVTLVGIISGDTSVGIPDFRGSERTFQIITQAGGRSGRGKQSGKVTIQTYDPENQCFNKAKEHDYEGFFEDEIVMRKEVVYPPFSRIVCLRVEGNKEERVVKAITALRKVAEGFLKKGAKGISILGP